MSKKLKQKPKALEFNDEEDIATLRKRVNDEAPESGSQLSYSQTLAFESLPISKRTLHSLIDAKLIHPTHIQAAAVPHALAGRDILGAAKTGSGKTLAFVIPMLELLYRESWGTEDGLGAVILTPTRELALQIFDVIRIIGKKHQLSAGLVTGGKKEFAEEQARVGLMNILVATPGRLLQHMEQTPGFDTSQLQMLILDEADRVLDMGFKRQLDSILEYLPPRQTLLFSATQTKSVKDLARLSLRDAEYVAVHEKEAVVTPNLLVQNYIICKLQDKLDTLYSFIKTHLKSKIIVFFSTCSQVRFAYECFRSMQPGIPLTALHGKIKQERRTIIFMDFTRRVHACLFATDVAARGLDFPAVDWVVQVDAPEDSAMYIHRVGRTARNQSEGRAMLFLMPHEENRLCTQLQNSGVPIKKLTVNPKHRVSVSAHASALLVSQPDTRAFAKKAFTSYLRSLQLLPSSSDDFDIQSLDLNAFANSLGLPITPELSIISKGDAGRAVNREKKNVNRALDKLKQSIREAKEAKRKAREEAKTTNNSTTSTSASKSISNKSEIGATKGSDESVDDDDSENDFFHVKMDQSLLDGLEVDSQKMSSTAVDSATESIRGTDPKKKAPRLKIRADADDVTRMMRVAGAKKVKFDDETGEILESLKLRYVDETNGNSNSNATYGDGIETGYQIEFQRSKIEKHALDLKARLDAGRHEDLMREQQRVREMHRLRRMKYKPEKVEASAAFLTTADEVVNEGGDDDCDHNDDFDYDNQHESEVNSESNTSRYKKRRIHEGDEESYATAKLSEKDDEINIARQEALALKLLGC